MKTTCHVPCVLQSTVTTKTACFCATVIMHAMWPRITGCATHPPTHTHIYTHTLTHSHTRTHTHTPTHTHTHLHTHTHTLAHTHTYTHTHLHTNKPTHQCCDPPLPAVPDGNWYCANCVARHSSQLHSDVSSDEESCTSGSEVASSDHETPPPPWRHLPVCHSTDSDEFDIGALRRSGRKLRPSLTGAAALVDSDSGGSCTSNSSTRFINTSRKRRRHTKLEVSYTTLVRAHTRTRSHSHFTHQHTHTQTHTHTHTHTHACTHIQPLAYYVDTHTPPSPSLPNHPQRTHNHTLTKHLYAGP